MSTASERLAQDIVETWRRHGFHEVPDGVATAVGSRVTLQLPGITYTLDVSVADVETIHWFPDDLVVRTVGMVPQYGVIVQAERVHGMTRLWVLRPGIAKPELWPGDECRLLRRVNKNKEGQ